MQPADKIVEKQPRFSTRTKKQPIWLNDFVSYASVTSHNNNFGKQPIVTQSSSPATFPFISPSHFSLEHISFVTNLFVVQEPKNYAEAKNNDAWVRVMEDELVALERNGTWEITNLPLGKKTIGCRWVYKVKLKADGSVDKYKAQLVAKRYNQKFGVDFHEIFSPVVKVVIVRVV